MKLLKVALVAAIMYRLWEEDILHAAPMSLLDSHGFLARRKAQTQTSWQMTCIP